MTIQTTTQSHTLLLGPVAKPWVGGWTVCFVFDLPVKYSICSTTPNIHQSNSSKTNKPGTLNTTRYKKTRDASSF